MPVQELAAINNECGGIDGAADGSGLRHLSFQGFFLSSLSIKVKLKYQVRGGKVLGGRRNWLKARGERGKIELLGFVSL